MRDFCGVVRTSVDGFLRITVIRPATIYCFCASQINVRRTAQNNWKFFMYSVALLNVLTYCLRWTFDNCNFKWCTLLIVHNTKELKTIIGRIFLYHTCVSNVLQIIYSYTKTIFWYNSNYMSGCVTWALQTTLTRRSMNSLNFVTSSN